MTYYSTNDFIYNWKTRSDKSKMLNFTLSDFCHLNLCHANATCNSSDSTCVCKDGFTGDGYTNCTEIQGM